MSFGAISARIGELRYGDFTWPAGEDEVAVLALDRDGVPVATTVTFAEKWSARGWHKTFSCPRCAEPARVLRVEQEGLFCGRCLTRETAHHQQKNSRMWHESKLADGIVRAMLSGSRLSRRRVQPLRRLGEQLRHRTMSQADAVIVTAARVVQGADQLMAEGDM